MEFEEISAPESGYSPLSLSQEVLTAKIFIRPIASNLSLSRPPVTEVIASHSLDKSLFCQYQSRLPMNGD
jgi:hypothetical protein